MCQANGICATPRHKGEFDHPLHFLLGLVVFFPVAIDGQHGLRGLVQADDVRSQAILVIEVMDDVALVDGAQAIDVVAVVLTAFDLVVGYLGLGLIGRQRTGHEVDVHVHARLDALLVLDASDVLHMSLALGRIEVRRSKGQVDVVNCHKLGDRALLVAVPSDLEVLATAQRQLSRQLLELGPELRHLLSHLPVHELDKSLGLFLLLKGDFTNDLVASWPIRREEFLHDAS